MNHRVSRRAVLAASIAAVLSGAVKAQDDVYVFSYFKNPDGLDGLHLAYSLDGFSWHAVNGDAGLLTPQSGSLMRDPSISRGADGVYRMVHTVSWGSTVNIGYAESTDLVNWTNQKNLPVMNGYTNISNTWAPELYYDAATNKHMIFWASGVDGVGHRIYETSTTDFNTFAPTVKFYDPGFEVIDATIVKDGDNHVMFVKDERQTGGYLYVFKAQGGTNAEGSYDTTTIPRVSGNYAFEGPTSMKIGDAWFVYGDRYGEGRMGLLTSTDGMQTWTDRVNDLAFPSGGKHGTIFKAPRSIVDNLVAQKATSQIEFDGNAGTTNLLTPTNWIGNIVPGTGQTPIIQTGHSAVLSQSLPGTQNEFWIGMTTPGSLTMTGGTITLSGWLCVGRNNGSAGSTFLQSGGTITTVNSSLGSVGTTAEGSYTLSNNARLAISGNLFLGERGFATMTQQDNAVVTLGNYADVGKYGTGTYNLTGGTLTASNDFNLADIRGSTGYLNVSGGSFSANALYVGTAYNSGAGISTGQVNQSSGTVRVTSGGSHFVVGGRDTAYGVGIYNLSGGTLQTGTSNFFIGGYGSGTLNQVGGSVIADQWVSIGRYAGATGTANISGGSFKQTNATMRVIVGEQGTGTLIVSGIGSVDLAGGLRISGAAGGVGTVRLNGGTLTTTFVEDNGGTSGLRFNGGALRARNSTATFLQGLDAATIETGGGIMDSQNFDVTIAQPLLHDATLAATRDGGITKVGSGTVTLTGNSTYTGHSVVNEGKLRFKPQGAATFPIQDAAKGDIVINGGVALLDYNQGASDPQTRVLSQLTASAPGGFQSGRIRTTLAADSTKAIGWINSASTLTLRYTYKGDFDLNGLVESTDFNTLIANYGTTGTIWKLGDSNYDGKVNTLDFNDLAGNFGRAAIAAPSLGAIVPEPGIASVLMGACAMSCSRRRNTRKRSK